MPEPIITRDGARYTLTMTQHLAPPPGDLFPFFADAFNLQKITPDTVKFKVVTPPPIEMREGAIIDYRLRIKGVPQRWRTEITVWDPPHRFVDEQRRGPYKLWHHEHTFTAEGAASGGGASGGASGGDGTRCDDRVDFEVGMGPLGHLAAALFVKRDVKKIFRHRAAVLHEMFGGPGDG